MFWIAFEVARNLAALQVPVLNAYHTFDWVGSEAAQENLAECLSPAQVEVIYYHGQPISVKVLFYLLCINQHFSGTVNINFRIDLSQLKGMPVSIGVEINLNSSSLSFLSSSLTFRNL